MVGATLTEMIRKRRTNPGDDDEEKQLQVKHSNSAAITGSTVQRWWRQQTTRRPSPAGQRRTLYFAVGTIVVALVVALCLKKLSYGSDFLSKEAWEYRWNRIVHRLQTSAPDGVLASSMPTRRQNLEFESHRPTLERELYLVDRHLFLLDRDMGKNSLSGHLTAEKTVVLLWSGKYPVWNAKVKMGVDETCNIPCEWTMDQKYNEKHDAANITGLACMLYTMEKGKCRDITESYLQLPILGISWENDWRNDVISNIDELPDSQVWKMKRQSPYNLISSYELDSHIPIIYPELADLVDQFQVEAFDALVAQRQDKAESAFFAISNCVAPIRPDRLGLIQALSKYYPISSFGKCLGNEQNFAQSWNSRSKYGNSRHLQEMGKFLFAYSPDNSYGLDYVSEKIHNALRSGAVPIYMGASNIAAFLPDRDAAIHVLDFASVQELGAYLHRLSQNRTLLVEKHHAWRTRPLPQRLLKLTKLVDRKSDYSYMCKVCNCIRGRIGCPDLTSHT